MMSGTCPFLKQVLLYYCSVYPTKKMVAINGSSTNNPCSMDYHQCPVYLEFIKQSKEKTKSEKKRRE
ncbi:hypothetical protein JXB22_05035 [candidate division WOR-3 bacterium]|nr:hypothetical protein [candidate division WOR-3 bacterium]